MFCWFGGGLMGGGCLVVFVDKRATGSWGDRGGYVLDCGAAMPFALLEVCGLQNVDFRSRSSFGHDSWRCVVRANSAKPQTQLELESELGSLIFVSFS
jgi:hypothetical protein